MPRPIRPQGQPTRGKTALNRLRRVDNYIALAHASTLTSGSPLVVDVGYGAYPWTALEMFERWLPFNPRLRLLGLEIDAERVAVAQPYAQPGRIAFALGGFNVARNLGAEKAAIIRAYNVLRQYDEADVEPALRTMAQALAPNGLLIEGTSNPSGRFVAFDIYQRMGGNLVHRELIFGWNFRGVFDVYDFQAILPKRLIHHAYDQPLAAFLGDWQQGFRVARQTHTTQRREYWQTVQRYLRAKGWPVDQRDRLAARGYLVLHIPLSNVTKISDIL
jgi:hypothetical protein